MNNLVVFQVLFCGAIRRQLHDGRGGANKKDIITVERNRDGNQEFAHVLVGSGSDASHIANPGYSFPNSLRVLCLLHSTPFFKNSNNSQIGQSLEINLMLPASNATFIVKHACSQVGIRCSLQIL